MAKKEAVRQIPKSVEEYYEFIEPISTAIRDGLLNVTQENPNTFSATDIHNALAMTMTYLIARDVAPEQREATTEQSSRLTEVMMTAGMENLTEDDYYVSLLLASVQTTTMIGRLIEELADEPEEEE